MTSKKTEELVAPAERIEGLVFLIRSEKVMLDEDLARHYQVETKVLNQAVFRNIDRFPEDFMFRVSKEEFEALRSQICDLKLGWSALPAQSFHRARGRYALQCSEK